MCLDMMDFDRKDFIMQKIAQSGMAYQQQMAMAQVGGMPMMAAVEPGAPNAQVTASQKEASGESSVTANARKRVAEAGVPT